MLRFRAAANIQRRSFASSGVAFPELKELRQGSQVHGYSVQTIRDIKDFDMTAVHLRHDKTGAQHMHVFKQDSNNVFNVAFQTAPHDSTGVAHILEHTALCGSDRFPVRDPFFKMMNRSTATFMNAMTYSDMTMYPFSTENVKDYMNLFNVYMDAVFKPRLRLDDFRQEGWRLEHEVVGDLSSPIIFKGVVYNEMKGVYSDVNNIFLTRLQESMLPSTIYANNSGGDPSAITDLSHKQLIEFHRRNYHPSNSRFFTYGSFPLFPTLKAIDEKISAFDKIETEILSPVRRFEAPKRIDATCPFDPMGDPQKQTRMSITYLTNNGLDAFESFSMSMLSNLLIDGAASPFYKALIESNIGSDYSPSTGYDRTSIDTVFSVGLQGIRDEDVAVVERLVREVFEGVARAGFAMERVESVLHQIELSIRHRKANFGMGLSQGVIQHWMHGGDPFDAMEVTRFTARLRNELKAPGFFESLVKKYFINNPHTLLLVMKPDESYTLQIQADEETRLKEKVSALTQADKQSLLESGIKLKQLQESADDVSCLPTLALADLPKETKTYPVTELICNTTPVQLRTTTTNGVTYLRVAKSLQGLPTELIPFVPLYCDSITALGTLTTPSLADLDERIRNNTSGVSCVAQINARPEEVDVASSRVQFSTSFLDQKSDPAFALMKELISETGFTHPEVRERLRTVLAASASGAMSSIAGSGHRYAVKLAARGITRPGAVKECMGGVEAVAFLNSLVERGDEGVAEALRRVEEVMRFVNRVEGDVRVAVNCLDGVVGVNQSGVGRLVDGLGWSSVAATDTVDYASFIPEFADTFIPLPFSVNYTARVFRGVPYTHPDSASLQILSELLTHRYLHREVREKGGAYGASATYDSISGVLSMSSYRDPPGAGVRTMAAFDRAVTFACDVGSGVSQRELDEAKLSVLGRMDAPVSASQEGMGLFGTGVTDEMRQSRRDMLFQVSFASLRDVAERYLCGRSSRAVLGPKDEGEALQNWKIVEFQ